jgi:hypothetical protein
MYIGSSGSKVPNIELIDGGRSTSPKYTSGSTWYKRISVRLGSASKSSTSTFNSYANAINASSVGANTVKVPDVSLNASTRPADTPTMYGLHY